MASFVSFAADNPLNRGNGDNTIQRDPPAAAGVGGTAQDTALLRSNTASILGLQSQAEIDAANASASDIQAAGYGQESSAYQTVSDIAGNNATVAGVAGDIKLLQEQRMLRKTIGAQRADVASAGFQASGTSIDLFRDTVSQGALQRQLTNIQTAQTKGGYLEEAAAAGAEVAGANMASTAATNLAATQRASGALATANAANETQALVTQIATQQNGMPTTPEQTLALTQLTTPAGQPTSYDPTKMAPVTLKVPTTSTTMGQPPVAPNFQTNPSIGSSNMNPTSPALARLAETGVVGG